MLVSVRYVLLMSAVTDIACARRFEFGSTRDAFLTVFDKIEENKMKHITGKKK